MSFVKQNDGSYVESSDISVVSAKVVDDTRDFDIPVSLVKCDDYFTESECIAAGCYWYGGACHQEEPSVKCEDYRTESECTAGGCYWYNGACHTKPEGEVVLPWVIILGAVGGVVTLIGIIIAIRR